MRSAWLSMSDSYGCSPQHLFIYRSQTSTEVCTQSEFVLTLVLNNFALILAVHFMLEDIQQRKHRWRYGWWWQLLQAEVSIKTKQRKQRELRKVSMQPSDNVVQYRYVHYELQLNNICFKVPGVEYSEMVFSWLLESLLWNKIRRRIR